MVLGFPCVYVLNDRCYVLTFVFIVTMYIMFPDDLVLLQILIIKIIIKKSNFNTFCNL